MLDTDRRFEDRLRLVLRDEADTIPFTLTFDELQRRLTERHGRRSRRPLRILLVAAALLLVGIVGAAGIAALLREPPPEPAPEPTLPSMSDLFDAVPEATTRLQGERDAADPNAPPAADDRYLVGQIEPAFPFAVVAACLGGDGLKVEVGRLEDTGTYSLTDVPCDGAVHDTGVTTSMSGERLDVAVLAPATASWILAVREFPESYADPPEMAPVAITPGWERFLGKPDEAPTLTSKGTGLAITVPPATTRVAAWITCVGEAPATATLGTSETTIDCPSGATERLEVPAVPSTRMDAHVTTDGLTWVRVVAEIDTGLEITYPSAPALPADVAAATWAASGTQYLTIGEIGGNAHRLIELPAHQASMARGDLVLVPVDAGNGKGRLDLRSIASGTVIRTVVDSPRFVQEAWLDATHEQAVYVIGTGDAIELRVVGLDGSDDHAIARVPVTDAADPLFTILGAIAHDDSVFVVEACRASGCERTIADLASGEITTVDTTDAPVCAVIGVIDGLVIGRHRDGCVRDDTAPTSVVVSPLEGGPSHTLAAPDGADGIVVSTADGPRVVLTAPPSGDEGQVVISLDPMTGESTTIHEEPSGSPVFVLPQPVRLPDGYVLLATSLSDDPAQRGFLIRKAPILIDLVSGERIELPNLPHSLGAPS